MCQRSDELLEAKKWECISELHWRGSFLQARAHRSPACAGIGWEEIESIVTTATPSMKVLRSLKPRDQGISEAQACTVLGGSQDIIVDVHLSPIQWIDALRDTSQWSDIEDDCDETVDNFSRPDGRAEHIPPMSRQSAIAFHRQRVLNLVTPCTPFLYLETKVSKTTECVRFMINGVWVGGRRNFSSLSSLSSFSVLHSNLQPVGDRQFWDSNNVQLALQSVGDGQILHGNHHNKYPLEIGASSSLDQTSAVIDMSQRFDVLHQHTVHRIHEVNNDLNFQGPTPSRLVLRGKASSCASYAHRCSSMPHIHSSSFVSCCASSSCMSCCACCLLGLTVCLCV